MNFTIGYDTVEENRNSFNALNGDDSHKKRNKKHTSLKNGYIHRSAQILKKVCM